MGLRGLGCAKQLNWHVGAFAFGMLLGKKENKDGCELSTFSLG
jgi:hypothetical protein